MLFGRKVESMQDELRKLEKADRKSSKENKASKVSKQPAATDTSWQGQNQNHMESSSGTSSSSSPCSRPNQNHMESSLQQSSPSENIGKLGGFEEAELDGHQMSKKDTPESARFTEEKEDTPESAKLTEEEEKSMQRLEVMYAATVLPGLFMWILTLVLGRGALLILILWGIYMIVVRSKVIEWNLKHPNNKI
ncbi:MAG: hypothetical protein J6Y90_04905, partial [Lachnospiraceae bacterium]|nr:hypothetical protein [Lachnospiraceae bacterium]